MKQNIFIAADAMVFRKENEQLQLLLVQRRNDPFKGMWAFPGGFVEEDEELEAAALRELEEETGLKLPALKQLCTVGTVNRDPRFRTVSVIHYAFIDAGNQQVAGGDDAADARWVNVKDITELAFDHVEILDNALLEIGPELTAAEVV
jgi:8-oxo-dGTP diphosphatase